MKLWTFFLVITATALQAVLPPLAESAREIKALVSDPKLYELLGSPEIILSILRTETGYAVKTQHYDLQVDVHYLHSEAMAGPARFEFLFHEPTIGLTD